MAESPGPSRAQPPGPRWPWVLICLGQAFVCFGVLPVILGIVLFAIDGGDTGMVPADANQKTALAILVYGLLLTGGAAGVGLTARHHGRRGLARGEFAVGGVLAAVTVCLVAAAMLSGPPARTITQARATARADQILRGTAAALDPRPWLEYDPLLGNGPSQCVDGSGGDAQMVNVSRTVWLRGIPVSRDGAIGRQVLAYWKKQGYAIQQANWYGGNQPGILGRTRDNFALSLDTSGNGWLSVGATSPCIYPDGHRPARPGDPGPAAGDPAINRTAQHVRRITDLSTW